MSENKSVNRLFLVSIVIYVGASLGGGNLSECKSGIFHPDSSGTGSQGDVGICIHTAVSVSGICALFSLL